MRKGRLLIGLFAVLAGLMVLPAMASATIGVDQNSVSFGQHPVGSLTTIPVNIINPGGPPATVTGFDRAGANIEEFTVTGDSSECAVNNRPPPGTIGADETCPIGVVFQPTSPGMKTAQLKITLDDGSFIPIDLSGEGTPAPQVSFNPNPVDFGDVPVGTTSAPRTVTVSASGTVPLHIGALSEGSGDTDSFEIVSGSDTCSNQTIPAGNSCEFKVTMSAALALGSGSKSLLVDVPSDDPDAGDQFVAVGGIASNPGISITPASPHNFGSVRVGTTGPAQTFTVHSSGATVLKNISATKTGADTADFTVDATDCSGDVPSGSTCDIDVAFAPDVADHTSRTATIKVASNAASSPEFLDVSGTGALAHLTLDPSPVDFGQVIKGQASAARTVTVTSDGTASAVIDSVGVNGPYGNNVSIVSNTCSDQTIPIGSTCQLGLKFTASQAGAISAELRIVTGFDNDFDIKFYGQIHAFAIDPQGTLSPASQDFGSVTVGSSSAAKSISVNSTGPDPLVVTSASITGADASSFQLANAAACNGSPATACALSVTFSPTGSAGSRSASLSVVTNAGTLTSALTGTAAAVPVITPKASLTLKAPKKVKRGKNLVVTSKVKGLSAGAIAGIVVAAKVSGPGKAPKSVKINSLGEGKTTTINLKVPVKKSAKPGKSLKVTVTVSAGGRKLASKKITAKIKK